GGPSIGSWQASQRGTPAPPVGLRAFSGWLPGRVGGGRLSLLDAASRRGAPTTRRSHSLRILSAHTVRATRVGGTANVAFLPSSSASRTPRAREHAVQTWSGILWARVLARISASGGQPTGTTALATGVRSSETASPSRKIWTSWPASTNAFAWRNGKAAFVGSSEPHALLIRSFIRSSRQKIGRSTYRPNTSRRRATISPSVARAFTSSIVIGIRL